MKKNPYQIFAKNLSAAEVDTLLNARHTHILKLDPVLKRSSRFTVLESGFTANNLQYTVFDFYITVIYLSRLGILLICMASVERIFLLKTYARPYKAYTWVGFVVAHFETNSLRIVFLCYVSLPSLHDSSD